MLALLRGGAQAPAEADSLPAWLVRALRPQPVDPLELEPHRRRDARRARLHDRRLEALDRTALELARMPGDYRRDLYRDAWALLGVPPLERGRASRDQIQRMQFVALHLLRADVARVAS